MKKLILLMGLFMVILAFNATAYADITYHFNRNNVQVEAYDCLDNACNTVRAFSGSFPDGKSTSNGELTIIYPSTLATQYGYAVFYFSPGRIPKEALATWHTNGDNTHYGADYDIDFGQIEYCRSTIDEFSVINDAYANEPLVINLDASMDATTHSAFREAHNKVGYIPDAYKDEYYSSEVTVTLVTRNSLGSVVDTQTRNLNIYMDSSERVEFTWTPSNAGTYTTTVTTTVTDDQCADAGESNSEKDYYVYAARPRDQCYTLMNDLKTHTPFPRVNNSIDITYTKISNYADINYAKTTIPTTATYVVYDNGGSVVYNRSQSLPANAGPIDPETQSYSWTPTDAGWYDITVYGVGNSNLCSGGNTGETISERVYVEEIPTYTLSFQLADSITGNDIEDARIEVGSAVAYSDANGDAEVDELQSGNYTYIVTHPHYQTKTGDVEIQNVDIDIMLALLYVDTAPQITSIPITDAYVNTLYNYDVEAYDPEGDTLSYSLSSYPGGMSINTNDGLISWTPTIFDIGQHLVRVVVTDGTSVVDQRYTLSVTLGNANLPPTALITANVTSGGDPLDVAFTGTGTDADGTIAGYNWDFGDGATSTLQNPTHTYTVPAIYTVTLTVTDDEGATGTDTEIITVTDSPDIPSVSVSATPVSGYAPLLVNLTGIATDSDGIIMSYAWDFGDGNSSNESSVLHIYNESGAYTATLTVVDNDGNTAQDSVVIRVLDRPGEGPYFTVNALHVYSLNAKGTEVLRPGDALELRMSFENVRDLKLDHLKVHASVPELGVWRSAGPFSLKGGKSQVVDIDVYIPMDAEPGLYDYRVVFNDDTVRKVIVRQFEIKA